MQLVLENNDDRYRIMAGNHPTGILNDAVFALLQGEKPEDWIITEMDENIFMYANTFMP